MCLERLNIRPFLEDAPSEVLHGVREGFRLDGDAPEVEGQVLLSGSAAARDTIEIFTSDKVCSTLSWGGWIYTALFLLPMKKVLKILLSAPVGI